MMYSDIKQQLKRDMSILKRDMFIHKRSKNRRIKRKVFKRITKKANQIIETNVEMQVMSIVNKYYP